MRIATVSHADAEAARTALLVALVVAAPAAGSRPPRTDTGTRPAGIAKRDVQTLGC